MSKVNRRSVVGGIVAAGAAALVPPAAGARTKGRGPAPMATKRPNVLFIMADDMGYADLSCTGSHHIRTPAIDSLARDGLFMGQGYSSTPICSPTRTALLTGRYAQRFKIGVEEPVSANAPPDAVIPLDQPTIASVLKAQGYRTHLVGKWHLGVPPQHGPLQHGYDSYFGIVEGAADYFRHRMVMQGKELGVGLARDNAAVSRDGYLTDLFGDEVVKIVEQSGAEPFFVSLHFNAPHWPWEGREDAAAAATLPFSQHRDGGSLAKYKEMVEALDQNVAKVLAALERSGKARDTIVVFTSDNGGERFSETWPFVGQKGEVLEGGIRVPLLVRWPDRIAPGSRSDQVMASMDFLPTFLSLAGGSAARAGAFDGMDLSGQWQGQAPVERTLFWRFNANNQAAVRQGDWKYVRLGGKEHLFNLAEDVHERAEKAHANPARLAQLKALWDEWNAQMLPYRPGGYSEQVKDDYPDRY